MQDLNLVRRTSDPTPITNAQYCFYVYKYIKQHGCQIHYIKETCPEQKYGFNHNI